LLRIDRTSVWGKNQGHQQLQYGVNRLKSTRGHYKLRDSAATANRGGGVTFFYAGGLAKIYYS
jgi:hypothetical protein